MMEPEELVKLLEKLRRKAPDIYRHIIGMVRAVLTAASN